MAKNKYYTAEELGVVPKIDKNFKEGRLSLFECIKEIWYECRNGHVWLDNRYYAVCPECGLTRENAEDYYNEEVYKDVLKELEEYREEKREFMDRGITEEEFIEKKIIEFLKGVVRGKTKAEETLQKQKIEKWKKKGVM